MSWSGSGADAGPTAVERALDSSPLTRRISLVVAVLAGTAAGTCAAMVLFTVVAGRPVPGAAFLLVIGIPLLVAGQFWTIGIMSSRQAQFHRANPQRSRWRGVPPKAFRGGLPAPLGVTFMVLFYAAWIGAMLSMWPTVGMDPGVPAASADDCDFALENHGEVTCVTEAVHSATTAGTQRFALLVLFGFFLAHAVVAMGDALERRPGGGVRGSGLPATE